MSRVFESGAPSKLPRGVFSTCPKANTVPLNVASNEYTIKDASGKVLMIVKNAIKLDHVKKAAVCAKYKHFVVKTQFSTINVSVTEFPLKCNIILHPVTKTPSPVVPEREYKIFGPDGGELMVVKGSPVLYTHLNKAAKCAGLKSYSVSETKTGRRKSVLGFEKFYCNVYLRIAIKSPVKKTVNTLRSVNAVKKKHINDAIESLRKLEKLL